jgi:Preprotein translocase subunit SecD
MKKNLLYKTILIIAVLLVFLFGIFGIPKSLSGDGLKTAVLDHVKLGLDLKGGTHLILQVQVNDAVRAEGERAIERLKDATQKANIAVGNIAMPDPTNHPETVVV